MHITPAQSINRIYLMHYFKDVVHAISIFVLMVVVMLESSILKCFL